MTESAAQTPTYAMLGAVRVERQRLACAQAAEDRGDLRQVQGPARSAGHVL
jgi:hypothetical protein